MAESRTIKAYAKLNLTLDITGVYEGCHVLDMAVASVSLCDEVTVTSRTDGNFRCYMDGVAADESNSAVKAAELMRAAFGCGGYEICIKKNIPMSGGLGGSTADGTAVIRAIADFESIEMSEITPELLLKLGSDAPCMTDTGFKRVGGRGEKVEKFTVKGDLPKIGIIAGSGVSTAACYKAFDDLNAAGNRNTGLFVESVKNDFADGLKYISNDLFFPATILNPDVGKAKCEIEKTAALAVNMSGSGSAVYGLYDGVVPDGLICCEFVL